MAITFLKVDWLLVFVEMACDACFDIRFFNEESDKKTEIENSPMDENMASSKSSCMNKIVTGMNELH